MLDNDTLACRFCATPTDEVFVDLGATPLANSLPYADADRNDEPWFPLTAFRCPACSLVQLPAVAKPETVFDDYPYFSSVSSTWVEHARRYVEAIVPRLGLGTSSRVVEIASNDGYLLQFFQQREIPALGVEPAEMVADAAEDLGIPTERSFFGVETAERLVTTGGHADLVLGNNVFAHVPDLNDFTAGLARLLDPSGTLTLEFPHLLELIRNNQFDTIYHEHFSYFWFSTACRILAQHGLEVYDVERLPTHGGSLRLYAQHRAEGDGEGLGGAGQLVSKRVTELQAEERAVGFDSEAGYRGFPERVAAIKRDLVTFLQQAKGKGQTVVGYGAPAKGNTLLNYCGVNRDLIAFTVDKAVAKQGRLLPGSRIPIHAPQALADAHPDYVLILPWNIRTEIAAEVRALDGMEGWTGQFVSAIPGLEIDA